MLRSYTMTNTKTGEQQEVDALSARDALAKTAGWRGIDIIGLDYYSGDWHTNEPYPWWYEQTRIGADCECGAHYEGAADELREVCAEGVLTCTCGATVALKGEEYSVREYFSVV